MKKPAWVRRPARGISEVVPVHSRILHLEQCRDKHRLERGWRFDFFFFKLAKKSVD